MELTSTFFLLYRGLVHNHHRILNQIFFKINQDKNNKYQMNRLGNIDFICNKNKIKQLKAKRKGTCPHVHWKDDRLVRVGVVKVGSHWSSCSSICATCLCMVSKVAWKGLRARRLRYVAGVDDWLHKDKIETKLCFQNFVWPKK